LDAAVYYSNLRVVPVGPPIISQVALNHANDTAVINFTTADGDSTVSSFVVQASATLSGFADVSASITALSAGAFQAVVPQSGNTEFYRIRLQ
jgi:acetaldehyde dehydrogenase (acetylating)